MGRRGSAQAARFPVARLKKIIQADEDIGKVAAATPIAVSKALELFMQDLLDQSVKETRERGAKKLSSYHLKRAVYGNETFDFLKMLVENVPDPSIADASSAKGASGKGKGRGKGKAKKEEVEEGDAKTDGAAGGSRPTRRRTGPSTGGMDEDEEDEDEDEDDE